jgi:membrane protease YdiL (CAAX protease family)
MSLFPDGIDRQAAGTPVVLDGSWERAGRSPGAAAIVILLGIGVLYFNVQSILGALAVLSFESGGSSAGDALSFSERMIEVLERHADPLRAIVVFTQYLFMLLPAWLLVGRWHTADVRSYVRLRRVPMVEIFLAVLATLAFIPTGTYIANEFTRQLNPPQWLEQVNTVLFTAHSPMEFLWLVFVVAVTPAVCEEIFFRGIVQRSFERIMGWKSAILIGVIFGLFHMQPLGLVTLSILGMLFGYFFFRSRSLYPAMAAHFANNFLAIFLMYQAPTLEGIDLASSQQIPLSWVAVSLPVGILLMVLYQRLTESLQQHPDEFKQNPTTTSA